MSKKTGQLAAFLAEPDNDPNTAHGEFGGTDRSYCITLFKLLEADNKRAKNRAAKLIALLAQEKPKAVYHSIDELLALLSSDQNILLWNALISLGHLASVDNARKIDAALPKILKLLKAETMVTAANTIDYLVNVAAAKPHLAGQIIGQLTRMEEIDRNDDCRIVLTTRVAKQLTGLLGTTGKPLTQIRQFAVKYSGHVNPRIAKPATRLLKKLG